MQNFMSSLRDLGVRFGPPDLRINSQATTCRHYAIKMHNRFATETPRHSAQIVVTLTRRNLRVFALAGRCGGTQMANQNSFL